MARPAAVGPETLSAWDDYPVHRDAELLAAVAPAQAAWSERFYFNVISPAGEILAIAGGGVYPLRGTSEAYCCRTEGGRQWNLRCARPLPRSPAEGEPGPVVLRCDVPLRDWTVRVQGGSTTLDGRFLGTAEPFLYPLIDVPASEPGGEFDRFRHFVAIGRWEFGGGGAFAGQEGLLGVRDRTWGVRSRGVRLHNWCVFHLGDRVLTLIHRERADGSVMFSHAGVVWEDGRSESLRVVDHHHRFDPSTREVQAGRFRLAGAKDELSVMFEAVGGGIRLAGAGYDAGQGARDPSGVQTDVYDLTDRVVAARTGRGTIDSGVRVSVTGSWTADGIGVVETAVARDHVRYGGQLA